MNLACGDLGDLIQKHFTVTQIVYSTNTCYV